MIDPHSGVPAHRQLADLLRGRITSGEFPPGSLLPPQPRLRYEYGVGKATVQAAMTALRAEGLIEWERGIGVRVREPVEQVRVALEAGDEVSSRNPTAVGAGGVRDGRRRTAAGGHSHRRLAGSVPGGPLPADHEIR